MRKRHSQIAGIEADAAEAERAAVLAEIEEEEDTLRARLETDGLTGWEIAVLHELDSLEDRLSA
ncbi:MAG TPA: hypothetical protein VK095_09285 [Beutenbergiaceae bacterium]|nr:hypothetical protein [Beutenbergiaceae bacterium]